MLSSNGRVTLASTTKTSLHDRFTKLAAAAPKEAPAKSSAPLRSSTRNRNLAVQMANKPSVQAALKIRNKTIKQRLGGLNTIKKPTAPGTFRQGNPSNNRGLNNRPVNNRPANNRPANSRQPVQARLGGRISGVAPANNTRLRDRLKFKPLPNQGSIDNPAANRLRLRKQNSFKKLQKNANPPIKRVNANNSFKNKNKSPRIKNLKGKVQTVGIKTNQRGSANVKPGPQSKQSLDMDLDQYMSKTKGHLDNDLDQYMAKSKSHLDADLDTYMSKAAQ